MRCSVLSRSAVKCFGYLSSWRDAHLVVEEHKDHPPLPIGLDDAEYEVVDEDEDDEDVLEKHSSVVEIAGVDASVSMDGAHGKVAVPTDEEYMAALDVCARRAEAADDIVFLKQLEKHRSQSNLKRKANASLVGSTLRKDLAAERIAEVARRKQEATDAEKLKIEAAASETKLAEARAKEHQCRQAAISEALRAKSVAATERKAQIDRRERIRWLVLEYIVCIAKELVAAKHARTAAEASALETALRRLETKGACDKELVLPEFWAEEGAAAAVKDQVREIGFVVRWDGKNVPVKCCLPFQWCVFFHRHMSVEFRGMNLLVVFSRNPQIYMNTYIDTYRCTYTRIYIHAYIHTYIHTHIHNTCIIRAS